MKSINGRNQSGCKKAKKLGIVARIYVHVVDFSTTLEVF
jgi:hypothetical protein